MATAAKPAGTEAFQFPDETDDKNKGAGGADLDDLEVEVVDDTPEADRGRKPMDKPVAEPTQDEIEGYTEGVKKRINELTHARHDERRQREQAQRELQELQNFARAVIAENESLKKTNTAGADAARTLIVQKAESDLALARQKVKDAKEAFDTDAELAAIEELSAAKFNLEVAKRQPQPSQAQREVVQPRQPQPRRAEPDQKTLSWQASNQWFGADGNEEATAFALAAHSRIINEGIDPTSDAYFERLNARIKAKFPELVGGDDGATKPPARTTTVVAPASRTTEGKQKVRLTTSQISLARRLGLTPQQYAEQVARLEKQNG